MTAEFERLERSLRSFGQEHLLQFWPELSEQERAELAGQIHSLDWELLRGLHEQTSSADDWQAVLDRAESPPAFRLGEPANRFSVAAACQAAEATLRAGKVGVVLVAGGQGTRLGFPHPKGMYRIGPVSERSLFQMHVEQLLAVSRKHGVRIPLYLMTSPATHEETVACFAAHDRFGLPAEDLRIFCQGTMPALDDQGKLILEEKSRIFLSPDGHGGMLAAWERSGGLADAQARGLEQIFYFQIDNPLVKIADRELLGYHLLAESDLSTLVVAKSSPTERVGNVVSVDGRLMVVEYSDLPLTAAERREADGRLTFWAGSIAVHVMRVDFLRAMAATAASLPFHRARKQIPFIDPNGQRQVPAAPNGTKFERFIFDLLPAARNAIVVEGAAAEVFAPLKNASGATTDTPETTRAAIVARARRWLTKAGCSVADGMDVELAPEFALDVDQIPASVAGTQLRRSCYVRSVSDLEATRS